MDNLDNDEQIELFKSLFTFSHTKLKDKTKLDVRVIDHGK